jgi:hypothetical protein
MAVAKVPVGAAFEDKKSGSGVSWPWMRFFQSLFGGTTIGIGSGAAGAVTAPAIGTGAGPANPGVIVAWVQVSVNGESYWIPLAQ